MPVRFVDGGKGPDDVGAGQAGRHMRVLIDVDVVVEIHEVMVADLPVDGQGDESNR
jgi:hypothetical protein